MTLPHDDYVQTQLLRLLSAAPGGRMYCQDVYIELAKQFPLLTEDEMRVPYKNSVSHWANRVQFARLHMVRKGWILHPTMGGGRGFWQISESGRRALALADEMGKKLLAELCAL
jgi:restriction endonuclease Mrr